MGTTKENKRQSSGKQSKNINPAHKGSGINSNFKKKERTKSKIQVEGEQSKKMNEVKDRFINAIRNKKKVRLTFKSEDSDEKKVKLFAPIDLKDAKKSDYAKSSLDKEKHSTNSKYSFLFWDYDKEGEENEITLTEEDIHDMEFLKDEFDPSDFEFWNRDWSVERDWDKYH